MSRFRLDQVEVRAASREAARAELLQGGRQVLNRSKILTPVNTGRLRASERLAYSLSGDRPSFKVTTNVEYAPYVHDGTRPHVIRPRRRQALKFRVGGMTVFAKVVNHPGNRARPFFDRALIEVARARGWVVRTVRRID